MAKTIKFNLILDEEPIRDIKGLQENFCINDILDFYEKGLLQKWLKVRGFEEYLNKVETIKKDDSAIIHLIKIFDIEKSEEEIKEAIYSLEFWEERKREIEEWDKKNTKVKTIIADYHKGYEALLAKIKENKEDMPFMKTAAKEIFNKYLEIFKIDYPFFFAKFKKNVPLIIYAILMNQNLRELFIKDEAIKDTLESEFSLSDYTETKSVLYLSSKIFKNTEADDYDEDGSEAEVIEKIQNKIKLYIFNGKTDGYWKDLEEVKTKVMVLSIPEGTFIRNANKPKEELSAEDVNGNFLIMDGLLYKSNTARSSIIYMEV